MFIIFLGKCSFIGFFKLCVNFMDVGFIFFCSRFILLVVLFLKFLFKFFLLLFDEEVLSEFILCFFIIFKIIRKFINKVRFFFCVFEELSCGCKWIVKKCYLC